MSKRAPYPPARMAPCNGCGFCCAAEVCRMGLAFFGSETPAPCPGLRFHDGRFWCSVIEDASPDLKAMASLVLGIGVGCDADVPEHLRHARNAGGGAP